jgi:YidC/Oxa1 family membrane protein insertase
MELWTLWLDTLKELLNWMSSDLGMGAGLSILVLTIGVRIAMLPISWSSAYRGAIRQRKVAKLLPLLTQIKQQFGAHPNRYAQELGALYAKHGLTLVDGRSLLAAVVQMPVFLSMYQVLRAGSKGARFLWIQSLAKPDIGLALLAGLTTMLMMLANPDLPQHVRLFMIVVPSILATLAALKFCSALAVYWTASNCFSAVQTAALHFMVARRIRSGAVTI